VLAKNSPKVEQMLRDSQDDLLAVTGSTSERRTDLAWASSTEPPPGALSGGVYVR
jgi:hypothetical protein